MLNRCRLYYELLVVHSFVRWLVLLSLLTVIARAVIGLRSAKAFTATDRALLNTTFVVFLTQASLGIWLYFISPLVEYFMLNFSTAVHQREPRFFGMEHITMMVFATLLVVVGFVRVRRMKTDCAKFKCALRWFGVAFAVVLISIPWGFAPLVFRPLFRFN